MISFSYCSRDKVSSKMYVEAVTLLVCVSLVVGRPGSGDINKHGKSPRQRDVKRDLVVKPMDHGHRIEQGDCLEGWVDGGSVGLGCVLADLADMGAEEPTTETVCKDFGEGGRLIEIFNMDQMNFLQTYLMQVSETSMTKTP